MNLKELANQLRSAALLIEDLKEVKEEKLPESWGNLPSKVQEYASEATATCNANIKNPLEALSQLYDLRQEYWRIAGDWEPDWDDEDQHKFNIIFVLNEPQINDGTYVNRFLTFPTYEQAQHFLKHHQNLIEEAQEFL